MIWTSCGTGKAAPTPMDGETNQSHGFLWKMHGLTPPGQASAYLANGSGSTRPRTRMAAFTLGAMNGMLLLFPFRTKAAPCGARAPAPPIRKEPVRLEGWILWAPSGKGPTQFT